MVLNDSIIIFILIIRVQHSLQPWTAMTGINPRKPSIKLGQLQSPPQMQVREVVGTGTVTTFLIEWHSVCTRRLRKALADAPTSRDVQLGRSWLRMPEPRNSKPSLLSPLKNIFLVFNYVLCMCLCGYGYLNTGLVNRGLGSPGARVKAGCKGPNVGAGN